MLGNARPDTRRNIKAVLLVLNASDASASLRFCTGFCYFHFEKCPDARQYLSMLQIYIKNVDRQQNWNLVLTRVVIFVCLCNMWYNEDQRSHSHNDRAGSYPRRFVVPPADKTDE